MTDQEITLKVLLVHMQSMERRLTSRIDNLDVRLSKRIDRLDTKFTMQIGNLDERLDAIEITLVEGKYDHRLQRLEKHARATSS